MDEEEKREKERLNDRFDRGELGALLKLFSSLGVTVAVGILGFFLLGLYLERKAGEWGWHTGGAVRIVFLLGGLAMTVYWAYLRIARHLDKYDPKKDGKE